MVTEPLGARLFHKSLLQPDLLESTGVPLPAHIGTLGKKEVEFTAIGKTGHYNAW